MQKKPNKLHVRLETSTTSSTLSARAVRGHGSDVLNAADLHAGTRQSTQRRLGAGARSARAHATRGAETDVESINAYNADDEQNSRRKTRRQLTNLIKKSEKYWGQRQNAWAGAVIVGRSGNSGQGQVVVGRGSN